MTCYYSILKERTILRQPCLRSKPTIGAVNGMYATENGTGGVMVIETSKLTSDKKLELTGLPGDVMKESMQVARTVACNLVSNKKHNTGIHVHCPDGSTPKDGPSAGLAITTAIYSLLSGKPVDHTVCMTGEIDLNGTAMPIGGLRDKLLGAKRAGLQKALCPKTNQRELEKALEECPELNTLDIVMVNNIHQVLEHAVPHINTIS